MDPSEPNRGSVTNTRLPLDALRFVLEESFGVRISIDRMGERYLAWAEPQVDALGVTAAWGTSPLRALDALDERLNERFPSS